MGTTWISWRTTTTVIITILQIQALISVRTTAVTGVEGQRFDFRCVYPDDWQSNAKYFCHDNDDNVSSNPLIRTDKHNQWERNGRFSLYDNITGAFFIVRVDKLLSEDSGTYRCGVDVSSHPDHISFIQLNVSKANPAEHLTRYITVSPKPDFRMDKFHLQLYLTAVMCVAAILCVCLFTLCLLLAVKHRRSGPHLNREFLQSPRDISIEAIALTCSYIFDEVHIIYAVAYSVTSETSSDYETMMPGVITEPEHRCSCSSPDCPDLSALPPPPPDLCAHFTSKHRESAVTLGLGEYVDVDVPGHICQYQHLDLSRLEEHIYHSLQGNSGPKDGPLGVKEQINC